MMIECRICQYHYSDKREHCPTCGTVRGDKIDYTLTNSNLFGIIQTVAAVGSERARQLPESVRWFETVD